MGTGGSSSAWERASRACLVLAASVALAAWGGEVRRARADADRLFELRVYHALPGKAAALEARFRDATSKILAKHGLLVVGYWVSEVAPGVDDRFIWVVAHASRQDAQEKWAAVHADPAFQELVRAEQADKLVASVDATYMRPTDFSPLK